MTVGIRYEALRVNTVTGGSSLTERDRGLRSGRMPRPRTDLSDADRDRLRTRWAASRKAQADAARARKALDVELRRLRRRYPVASIARSVGVTPGAIWKRLRK